MSEHANQAYVRQHFTDQGDRLFRNNVGVLMDTRGIPVRYGLANDTRQLNATLKSADLIGWRPRLVTPEMVGTFVAQFVSIETKAVGWKMPGETAQAYAAASAQRRWARMVRDEGGIAGFMIDPLRGFEPEGT